MTYVDGLSNTLADIGQIQEAFASLPGSPGPLSFDGVLQQIASITALGGQGATTSASQMGGTSSGSPGSADLSANYGWPMDEGAPLPGAAPSPASSPAAPVTAGASGRADEDGADVGAGPVWGAGTGTGGPGDIGLQASDLGTSGLAAGQPGGAGTSSAAAGLASSGLSSAGSPGSADSPGSSSQDLGQQAVVGAEKFLGVPYLWGGTNPAQGVDCSGLVQDVYGELGINLPRTSQEQATVGVAVPSLADAQPGDLVFFPGSDGTAAAPGHVGVYIGNGQMIDAPYTGADVRVDPVGNPTEIRRVTGLATSGGLAATAYQTDFATAANAYGVPEQLLTAVASTESSFQPGAVSGAGAEGLMQLMPATASSLGVDPFDPAQAINGAAQLLSSYHNTYGSWSLALAAYNAGPGAVDQYSGVPPYPQTQAYVQNVLTQAGMEDQ